MLFDFLSVDTSLVTSCLVLSGVFLALPLPAERKGLKNYRISLRTLAISYFAFALLIVISHLVGESQVDLLSFINLNISSIQALLIAMSLFTLLHPELVTRKYILKHLWPLIVLNAIYLILAIRWGNPMIGNQHQLLALWLYPPVLLRELFLVYYVIQLGYLSWVFVRQIRYYESLLDNYFADEYQLHLPWVVICFISALLLGIFGVFMMAFFTWVGDTIFRLFCLGFYTIFGICYIQYPRTYVKVEQAMQSVEAPSEGMLKINARLSWPDLKTKIIETKYYTRVSVNIEDMAQYLKVGRTTLSGFINKEEGVNFNAWIRTLRTEEAIRIFAENSDYSISQVSEMVGYSEPSNFSRQFKLATGFSPSEWCQKQRILS